MRKLILIFSVTSLISCSFGGFKPPNHIIVGGRENNFIHRQENG